MTPIVLHHGLFGFGDFKLGPLRMSYFRGIDDAIAARGHPVITPRVHPTGGVAMRAEQLKQALLEQMNGQKVVIVAHSLGGLDARYMISRLGMADRVAALVTISTPHRGTAFADWFHKHLGTRLGGIGLMKGLRLEIGALHDLMTEQSVRFNAETPDAPGVKYYSISAARPWHKVPPWAVASWRIVNAAEGPNDALVSVRSAAWGEHLETWPADHWHTINKRFVVEGANRTGDIVPYYLRMLDRVIG